MRTSEVKSPHVQPKREDSMIISTDAEHLFNNVYYVW